MIKRYCDACGIEIKENRQVFSPLCHLVETDGGQYVDREWNPISGRYVEFDLCLKCYNWIMGKAVQEMREIQEKARKSE